MDDPHQELTCRSENLLIILDLSAAFNIIGYRIRLGQLTELGLGGTVGKSCQLILDNLLVKLVGM